MSVGYSELHFALGKPVSSLKTAPLALVLGCALTSEMSYRMLCKSKAMLLIGNIFSRNGQVL